MKDRAMKLLILIDEHTKRAEDGTLERFWIPSAYTQYIHFSRYDASGHLPEDITAIGVSGSGDAARLKFLERHGYISRPKTSLNGPYIYAITEEGKLEIERYREGGKS